MIELVDDGGLLRRDCEGCRGERRRKGKQWLPSALCFPSLEGNFTYIFTGRIGEVMGITLKAFN